MRDFRKYIRYRGFFFVLLFCALALSCLLALIWQSMTNNLYRNGRWISTKTTIVKRPMYAFEYILSRQTLGRGILNLGMWDGFNEVLWKEDFAFGSMSADVNMSSERSTLFFVVGKNEKGCMGVKIPSGDNDAVFFRADSVGRFTETRPIGKVSVFLEHWHRIELKLVGGGLSLLVDGNESCRIADVEPMCGKAGFRNYDTRVLVDNVRLRDRGGKVVARENFSRHGVWPQALGFSLLAVSVGMVAFWSFAVLLLRQEFPATLFTCLSAGIIALLFAIVFFWADYFFFSERVLFSGRWLFLPRFKISAVLDSGIQGLLNREAAYVKSYQRFSVRGRLKWRYRDKASNVERIVFVGSSQTWGEGTRADEEIFVARAEHLLRAEPPLENRTFECVNTGVAGLPPEQVLEFYKKNAVWLKADLCIANLSNYLSPSAKSYARVLVELADFNRKLGIRTIFAHKASYPFAPAYRRQTERVGRELGVDVWDAHEYMTERFNTGFIWWDTVHMTPFGHDCLGRFFAFRIRAFYRGAGQVG